MRSYLIQSEELIGTLAKEILVKNQDDDILQNAVGILQKVSLNIEAQDLMVSNGVVKALFSLVGRRKSTLSDYTLEYSLALLMNLSLNSKAKIHIEKDDSLSCINALLSIWDTCPRSVRHFLNATMYSFLFSPSIQLKAKHANVIDKVRSGVDLLEPNLQTQIDYIVKRINGEQNDEANHRDVDIMDIDCLTADVIEQITRSDVFCNPDLDRFLESYSLVQQEERKPGLSVLGAYFESFLQTFRDMVSFEITSEPFDRRGETLLAYTGTLTYTGKPVTPSILHEKFDSFSYTQTLELNQTNLTSGSRRRNMRSRFGTEKIPENDVDQVEDFDKGVQSKMINAQRTPISKDF